MVSVNVYVVVTKGLTIGFATLEVNPNGDEVQL